MQTQVTLVKDLTAAANEAFSGKRSRPVVALAGDQMVVCCKKTAKKHGWEVQGKLYARTH
jgi:hypothetical protein